MKSFFLIGTYTTPVPAGPEGKLRERGEGIYLCSFEDGKAEVIRSLKMINPSFLTIDERRRHVYAVNETRSFEGEYGGGITDLTYDEKGCFSVRGVFHTGGTDPCHIAVSPDGAYVCAANYSDGRVTAFRLDKNGNVLPERMLFEHDGKGPNAARQEGPHAHCVLYAGGGRMYVVDLGTDQLRAFRIEKGRIASDEENNVRLVPGIGPRTGAWSADGHRLYLTNELGSSVTLLMNENGTLRRVGETPTLPEGTDGTKNYCADVHLSPDEKTLYVSNRGHDSIAVFSVAPDGRLTAEDWTSSGGSMPRQFSLDPSGKYMLIGNQNGDCVTVLRVLENGRLEPCSRLEIPAPVCIQFFRNTDFEIGS